MQCIAQIYMQHAPEPNWEKAISTFDDIIDIDPISIKSYCDAGHCHYKLDNKKEARKMYEKAIRTASLCDKRDEVPELVFMRCGLLYN